MERAHMQRTALVVISREISAPFYADCERRAGRLIPESAFPDPTEQNPWPAAEHISSRIFDSYPKFIQEKRHRGINHLMSLTYGRDVEIVFDEAIRSQTHFPLHLARDITNVAAGEGARGYEIGSLGDIARFLRRPDFREMVDTAAFTANGVWGRYSTDYHGVFSGGRDPDEGWTGIAFAFNHTAGTVDFTPSFKAFLRRKLAAVNAEGISVGGHSVTSSTSSGCPARRLRPSFTASEDDQQTVRLLADHFHITPEAVIATHGINAIDKGIDLLADTLARLQQEIDKRNNPQAETIRQRIANAVGYVCRLWAEVE